MATDPNQIPTSQSDADQIAKQKPSVLLEDDDELRKVFERFDANGDGKISITELDAVLTSLTLKSAIPLEELRSVMDDLDSDKDGYINIEEFAAFCKKPMASDEAGAAELRDAFDLYDQDRNGLISQSELHLVLNRLGISCSKEDCQKMINSVDSDGDGNVNFEEFRKMMTDNSKSKAAKQNGTAAAAP
ncbi:putative calcium-binding protein CML27 [Cucumis melo var. makuwa]|uniref:Calcium-binding protein CML27 n=2 Tax=Cucumis melo TaxID=3656 RepID=A0A5D3DXJ8_CUCMM|nr:probable calcium-binding protein CML27 [Cucumis melo]KAA0058132.1 putative calcium-binding protein CML27 [Cucumis melo var. makuwa]TYK28486.1 putative calcium-binding protein CML27 [Cucumis melo var. makuwa]